MPRTSPPHASSRGSRPPAHVRTGGRRARSSCSAGPATFPQPVRDSASLTPSPGWFAGSCTPSRNSTPGHGSSGEQQVAVEVDVVHQRRDLRAGRDRESRLHHAAEHDAELERARRMRHAHGPADPPDFSLMLMPCARSAHARRRRACGSPRRRRSTGERRFNSGPPGSPSGSGCSQYSIGICGRYSSASSSVQYSLTSTCSGTSVTARTWRTRSRSSPSRAPSFSLSRWKRFAAASARRAMSSGSPSQTVHDVGGPPCFRPSSRQTGTPASLPQRSCSAASIAARAANSRRGKPLEDLVEREGIVPELARVLLDVRERGLRRLAVAVDRGLPCRSR